MLCSLFAVAHSGCVVTGGPWQGAFFADQWVAKGSGNGLGGKTEKAFKRELGGLGFTPKASPENGGGVKEEVPAGRLQQDSE